MARVVWALLDRTWSPDEVDPIPPIMKRWKPPVNVVNPSTAASMSMSATLSSQGQGHGEPSSSVPSSSKRPSQRGGVKRKGPEPEHEEKKVSKRSTRSSKQK